MSLPFILTLFRIVMSPVFLFLYLYAGTLGIKATLLPYILILILTICEVSDFLDGFFARRRNKVTALGKVLDPMADSIFRLTVFFTLTQGVVQLPLLLVVFFFFRDSLISMLRTLCALNGVTLAARVSGKVKAVVQAVTAFFILTLMIPYTQGSLQIDELQTFSFYAALVAVTYTLISGVEYVYANWMHVRRALNRL